MGMGMGTLRRTVIRTDMLRTRTDTRATTRMDDRATGGRT